MGSTVSPIPVKVEVQGYTCYRQLELGVPGPHTVPTDPAMEVASLSLANSGSLNYLLESPQTQPRRERRSASILLSGDRSPGSHMVFNNTMGVVWGPSYKMAGMKAPASLPAFSDTSLLKGR